MPAFELCITDCPGLDGTYEITECSRTEHVSGHIEVSLNLVQVRQRPRRNVIANVPDRER